MTVLGSTPHELDNNKIQFDDIDELLKAIKNRKAVVYVGAGASISAGFPDWKKLINEILKPLEGKKKNNLKIARKFYDNEDFVMAAELIELESEGRLSKFIEGKFNAEYNTSPIHSELVRIPFSFAITTNFDNLLEKAYEARITFTWENISDFFRQIRQNKFQILKTHGDPNFFKSHVIRNRDFNSITQNKVLNSHIVTFMALNTFLFVGSSLRDPDLINVLKIAKSIYGVNFGPHYAILFEDEVDDAIKYYLRKSYDIHVIQINESDGKKKTEPVVSFLRYLSGKVASIEYESSELIALNSETFNFKTLVQNRLRELVSKLGVHKAMLFLIDRRDLPGLKYKFIEYSDPKRNSLYGFVEKNTDKYYDLIKALYQLGSKEPITFYIDDLDEIDSYPKIKNVEFDVRKINRYILGEHRSIIITQVFSDGECIGVIAVESASPHAFTTDHIACLKNMGVIISSLCRKLELRNSHLRELNLAQNASAFNKILDSSYLLDKLNLNYLFYEIDYREGRLKAHFDKVKLFGSEDNVPREALNFYYSFEKTSFANHILKNSSYDYCENIEEGISEGKLSKDGVEIFKIGNNPIYGTSIRVGQHVSFILVAWSKTNESIIKIKDKIFRIAHLIANSNDRQNTQFEKAERFISHVNDNLREFDKNKPWELKMLNPVFRENVISALLQSLTSNLCGLARVRLWSYDKTNNKFICIYSFCTEDALFDSMTQKENNYKGQESTDDDEYCKFTINRFEANPYAMLQHWSMFDEKDINNTRLNKDPEGKWIVSPIVYTIWEKEERKPKRIKKRLLVGYISADNHIKQNNTPKENTSFTDQEVAFQKYALDCISDLLSPILYNHNFNTYEKR